MWSEWRCPAWEWNLKIGSWNSWRIFKTEENFFTARSWYHCLTYSWVFLSVVAFGMAAKAWGFWLLTSIYAWGAVTLLWLPPVGIFIIFIFIILSLRRSWAGNPFRIPEKLWFKGRVSDLVPPCQGPDIEVSPFGRATSASTPSGGPPSCSTGCGYPIVEGGEYQLSKSSGPLSTGSPPLLALGEDIVMIVGTARSWRRLHICLDRIAGGWGRNLACALSRTG